MTISHGSTEVHTKELTFEVRNKVRCGKLLRGLQSGKTSNLRMVISPRAKYGLVRSKEVETIEDENGEEIVPAPALNDSVGGPSEQSSGCSPTPHGT